MDKEEERTNKLFWDNIDYLLHENRSTIYKLSVKIGLSERSLLRCKERNTVPKVHRLIKIANEFNMPVELLFAKNYKWYRGCYKESILKRIYALSDEELEVLATHLP